MDYFDRDFQRIRIIDSLVYHNKLQILFK